MLYIILNIWCSVKKTFQISAFVFWGETTKENQKTTTKKDEGEREGISHHTMHLLETSYTYKPVLGGKKRN